MKKFPSRVIDFVIWGALAVALIIVVKGGSSGPKEGVRAAPIDLPLVDGEGRFRLSEHHGKPVIVEVFASWCGTCRRAAPLLSEAHAEHAAQGVKFVAVSVDDSVEAAAGAKQRWQIPYDVVLDDGSVSRNYQVSLLPTVVFIGRDGVVRRTMAGVPSRSEIASFVAEK